MAAFDDDDDDDDDNSDNDTPAMQIRAINDRGSNVSDDTHTHSERERERERETVTLLRPCTSRGRGAAPMLVIIHTHTRARAHTHTQTHAYSNFTQTLHAPRQRRVQWRPRGGSLPMSAALRLWAAYFSLWFRVYGLALMALWCKPAYVSRPTALGAP